MNSKVLLRFVAFAACLTLLGACAPRPAPVPAGNQKQSGDTNTSAAGELPNAKPAANYTANEILQRLLATYRRAKTYQDQAVVRLSFREGDRPATDQWPAAVAFERPNKLSLAAYQATVKSDGEELRARIVDPVTGNVDNQIVIRPAPSELKLSDLASDQLLYDILSSQLRRQPIQLELLIESGGLISAFSSDVACQRLDDGEHDGQTCFRVEVPSPGGPFVFWVDQDNFLLRRLDYPAAALVPDLVNAPGVTGVQLYADLRGVKIDGTIPASEFALEVPAGAKRMKTFARPVQPLPTDLLGKLPGEFFFHDSQGERVTGEQLAGKIAVLVWYHNNPACEATLQQVSLARERLKDKADAVTFYAIATDPTSATDDDLARTLAGWKVALPIVRDLEAFGDKAFHIEVQPTIVVLDAEGRVQIFQEGGNAQLADYLVEIVGRLSGGEDVAASLLATHERERAAYDQLVARGGPEPGELLELPEAVIRKRSEPRSLKLKELWTNTEVKSPGNFVLVEETDQSPRVFIFEGWRGIAEIDAKGQVAARHALDLPEQAIASFARTATDKTGNRLFVAAAPFSPQVFVFDADWKLLHSFPPASETPLQVMDLTLADLGDADGQPDIVAANVGALGLMAFSLEGDVLWRNRAFQNVISVAPARDDFQKWVGYLAGEAGTILRVNRFGNDEPAVAIADWPVSQLNSARFLGAKQAQFLAISSNPQRELFAVGITDKLKEAWNYPLPSGVHQKPIEPVTSSNLLPGRQGEWWLAGPDGSVHVISEDGEFHDSFHTGAALTGLAATKLNDRPVLLIASDAGVTAWAIE